MICLILAAVGGCVRPVAEREILDSPDAGYLEADASDDPVFGDAGNDDNRPGLLDSGEWDPDSAAPPSQEPVDQPPPEESKPGECGASSFEATQVIVEEVVEVISEIEIVKPVVLYVMMDRSASMNGLWNPAVSALKSFVNDADSKDIGVGMQFFPINGGSCNGNGYKSPAVNVGQLPDHADAIESALDKQSPSGLGTPVEGALRGVTDYCKKYQTDHQGVQCVSVLVTDGEPQLDGCEHDSTKLANIAAAAKAVGVTTFAVGLKGANFSLLNKIGQAGGADCDPNSSNYACNLSSGADALAATLASIRDTVVTTEKHTEIVQHVEHTALPCEWEIPAQPEGKTFDPNKVNIQMSAEDVVTTFGRVADEAGCGATGWHFDSAEAPTRLIACPQACELITAAPEAKIDVLLGCETVELPPLPPPPPVQTPE